MTKQNIFRLVFGVLILAAAFLFYWLMRDSFVSSDNWLWRILLPIFAFLLLGILLCLINLIESNRRLLLIAPVLILAPFLFFVRWELGIVWVLVLGALFLLYGVSNSQKEKAVRLKLSTRTIFASVLGPTITALAMFGAILYFDSPAAQKGGENLIIPRGLFDIIVKPMMTSYIQNLFPAQNNSPALSEEEIYRALNQQLGEYAKNIDKKQLDNLVKSATASQPKTQKSAKEKVEDELYNLINQKINTLGASYKKYIPFGLAVSFFFTLKLAGYILSWLVVLLAWIVFKILVMWKVVKINMKQAEREVIEI